MGDHDAMERKVGRRHYIVEWTSIVEKIICGQRPMAQKTIIQRRSMLDTRNQEDEGHMVKLVGRSVTHRTSGKRNHDTRPIQKHQDTLRLKVGVWERFPKTNGGNCMGQIVWLPRSHIRIAQAP